MIVSCTNCNSNYSVNDSKVRGKRFGFNCPKCGTNVEIDNREKRKRDEGTGPVGMEMESGSLTGGQDIDLPGDNDLMGALENLTSKEEDSLNMENIDLPDFEDLGEISEAGETAEDAINITSYKAGRDMATDEEKSVKFDDNFLDELDELDTEADRTYAVNEKESGLLDDFNPIEGDISDEKEPGKKAFSPKESTKRKMNGVALADEVKSDEIFSHGIAKTDNEDEDITIDLDSLDIQLEEDFDESAGKDIETEELSDSLEPSKIEGVEITDLNNDIKEKAIQPKKRNKITSEDDEDITLDLDALDLTLDEVEELKEGEAIDTDDDRISLSDVGLTPDELVKEDELLPETDTEEEDIRLNIDEVAPEVSFDREEPKKKRENLISIEEEELPEIDLDKFDQEDNNYAFTEDEDTEDIRSRKNFKEHEAEIASPDADIRDTVPGGIINFSIDYSLRFSRIGAIFRLLFLYPILLIPHFIVLLIYSVLSFILSFINWIIIIFTGIHEEDFIQIQENTIRYLLSLSACCIDLVEEKPRFAGRKDIEYSFQYDATYPITYSRILAVLRITVIGILLTALPHIILLAILSMGSALISLAGILAIIIRKKWPNILFDFMTRYFRYAANVLSYITGVIDRYPSFKFI